ncbi:hypothetical protein AGMMS50222_02180 [Endomicrobiia bacterium]|nr:hypothetical protein AGMMS49556_02040 [Endomicrobiia bacterium]GHT73907.1 hypothetical protein AGMMS50222_02180 [Endomicrobiia bacterium]
MNKKMAVALTVSTFLLTANVTASVLAADNVSDQSGVKVSVDGMFNSERREFSKRSEDDRSKRY